ncbi:MAG: type II secretion system protein [bacterium]|nr:type II secretion system protein [bacterium]
MIKKGIFHLRKIHHHTYHLLDWLLLKRFRRGFTLIELLVVIAILAILSAIGMVTYSGISKGVNDTKRKSDINGIAKAYEVNYSGGIYHPLVSNNFGGGIIPQKPEGGDYDGLLTGDASGFQVCAALEANPSRTCFAPATDCYCKQSSQGIYIASTSSPAPSSSPLPSPALPPPIYKLGIGYFPLNSIYNSPLAWSKAKDVAHVAFIQRHWRESLNSSNQNFYDALAQEVSEAKNNGLKIYLAFEVLSPDRSSLELPAGLVGDFSTPVVQNAYINMVSSVAAAYKPDYFILNVEINSYKSYQPADYSAYKALYNSAYDAVKSASNNTKIAVSLAYIDVDGINCIDGGDKTIFNNYIADFQTKMDILAVSTYPLCYFDPAVIPENFLDELASFSSKPLFIAETGWMSESFTIPPSFTFPSSPQLQADFVNRLKTMADYAINQGKNIDAINYVAIVDMETSICDAIIAINPAMGWYCTLALIDKNGTEKTAFQRMKVWKNSL